MDPLTTLKELTSIVKKFNDLDLMKKIVDLQTEIFEITQQNVDLKRELVTANGLLQDRENLELREIGNCNFYFKEGDPIPFCPKCYEGAQKKIHLSNAEPWNGGIRRDCIVCSESYYEKPMDLRPVRIGGRNRWSIR